MKALQTLRSRRNSLQQTCSLRNLTGSPSNRDEGNRCRCDLCKGGGTPETATKWVSLD